MRFDSSSLSLLGLFIVMLGFVYATATLARNRKRQTVREQMEADLAEREKADSPTPEEPASTPDPVPVLYATRPYPTVATVKPVPPTPRPKALLAWSPPASDGPPHFNRYITWPETKIITPVAEQAPTDQNYVWD